MAVINSFDSRCWVNNIILPRMRLQAISLLVNRKKSDNGRPKCSAGIHLADLGEVGDGKTSLG